MIGRACAHNIAWLLIAPVWRITGRCGTIIVVYRFTLFITRRSVQSIQQNALIICNKMARISDVVSVIRRECVHGFSKNERYSPFTCNSFRWLTCMNSMLLDVAVVNRALGYILTYPNVSTWHSTELLFTLIDPVYVNYLTWLSQIREICF